MSTTVSIDCGPVTAAGRSWQSFRAEVASLTRSRKPDDPELLRARRNLERARRADRIAQRVAEVVAAAPELTVEQRDRLATLLRGGPDAAA